MLAYPAEEKRIKDFPSSKLENGTVERKFFHQPKLNGERARVEWFGNNPYLISSYGNEFKYLNRIQNELNSLCHKLGKQVKFDGEVYVHGWPRERIDSALRRTKNKNPETDYLEYHIFDYQTRDENDLQWNRLRELGTVDHIIQDSGLQMLKVVPYGVCSEIDWMHHCGCYCEDGYEGIILRNPFASYEEKRIPGLLKFKPTEHDTYEIVAVNEATTSDTGEAKGMVGSFTVRGKEDNSDAIFDVGAGKLKHTQRIDYFNRKEECIGRMLLVKHEMLRTTNQVPIAAVTVDVVW